MPFTHRGHRSYQEYFAIAQEEHVDDVSMSATNKTKLRKTSLKIKMTTEYLAQQLWHTRKGSQGPSIVHTTKEHYKYGAMQVKGISARGLPL